MKHSPYTVISSMAGGLVIAYPAVINPAVSIPLITGIGLAFSGLIPPEKRGYLLVATLWGLLGTFCFLAWNYSQKLDANFYLIVSAIIAFAFALITTDFILKRL